MVEMKKAIVSRYFDEVVCQGQLDAIDELVATDYINHSLDQPVAGRESLKNRVRYLRGALRRLSERRCNGG